MPRKTFILKRFLISPPPAAVFDARKQLHRMVEKLDLSQRVVTLSRSNSEEIALHRYQDDPSVFLGQASVFRVGKVQEALRIVKGVDQLAADEVQKPTKGGEWIDASSFFAVSGNLLALAVSRGVTEHDLERMFFTLLGPSGANVLPAGTDAVFLQDARSPDVIAQVEGAEEIVVETFIDDFAMTQKQPSKGTDLFVRPSIAEFIKKALAGSGSGPQVSALSMGNDRLRVKVAISVDGGLRGHESAVMDRAADMLRNAKDANTRISLGKAGKIKKNQLQITAPISVPNVTGEQSLVEVGSRLSDWMQSASELNNVPLLE